MDFKYAMVFVFVTLGVTTIVSIMDFIKKMKGR